MPPVTPLSCSNCSQSLCPEQEPPQPQWCPCRCQQWPTFWPPSQPGSRAGPAATGHGCWPVTSPAASPIADHWTRRGQRACGRGCCEARGAWLRNGGIQSAVCGWSETGPALVLAEPCGALRGVVCGAVLIEHLPQGPRALWSFARPTTGCSTWQLKTPSKGMASAAPSPESRLTHTLRCARGWKEEGTWAP